jgi:hypothetical protein
MDALLSLTSSGQTQTVITIDDENNRIGINSTAPQYDLEVRDTIATSNLIADGLIQSSNILNTGTVETTTINTSNLTADGLVQSSNILNTATVETHTLSASDITGSNVETHTLSLTDPQFSTNSNFQGLISINGYDISQPFPTADGSIGGSTVSVKMHLFIRRGYNTIRTLEVDLWSAGELGVDIAQTLADAYQFFQGGEDALTQAAIEALGQALDNMGDETDETPKICRFLE